MPIFSEAIVRLKAVSRHQKHFFPASLRDALALCVDTSITEAQQCGVIFVFITHHLGESMRYAWLPACRQFKQDLNTALFKAYSLKPDELIDAADPIPGSLNDEQRMSALYILSSAGLFNTLNHNKIRMHPAPYSLSRSLYLLSQSRLLNQNTVDFVINHANSVDFSRAVTALSLSQLLNKGNLNLLQGRYKNNMGSFLRTISLFRHDLLNQANFLLLLRVPADSMPGVVEDLETLSRMYILSPDHLSGLFRCAETKHYNKRAGILSMIHHLKILTSDLALLLLDSHNEPVPLICIVRFLSQPSLRHMLTHDLLTTILTAHAGRDLDQLLQRPFARMLNQSAINAFIQQPDVNRDCLIQIFAILGDGLEQKKSSHPRHVFFVKPRVTLLNADNINRIMRLPAPSHLLKIASILCANKRWRLTQRDLSALLNHTDIVDVERRLTALCDGSFGILKQQKEIKALLWGLLEPIAERQEDEPELCIERRKHCNV